jgi:membrane-bound lytic murein transglycosylase A
MSIVYRIVAVLAIGLLTSCAASPVAVKSPAFVGKAKTSLATGKFQELDGWSSDRVADAVPAFVKSCERATTQKPDGAPLDPAAQGGNFGVVRDWRPLCTLAANLPRGDEGAARRFFEKNFVPVLVASKGASTGLVTGYWEAEFAGSRTRQGPFQTPVYRRPPDLADNKPYLDRAAIEDGALAGKGLEVAWLRSPDDLFVLQLQGSGRIRLEDGGIVRLVTQANNNRPFVDVNQMLVDDGTIPKAQFSENSVRGWMRDNPGKAAVLRRKDPLYVFFREKDGDGPVGYQGAVLTAKRSLAVDQHYIPLGAPLWLDARDKYRPVSVQRLVVTQDTNDGITGPLRGDFYWGSGKSAAARGSDFYADGRYWLLLPKAVATRMVASLN